MNTEEFVNAIKLVVEENSLKDVIKNLTEPVIKLDNHRLNYLSQWFQDLDEHSKECIHQIIKETSQTVLFSFFCVLDGVRAIENGSDKGHLELNYIKGDKMTLLNDFDNSDFLHDIYNRE